jgi:hypothetical protein
MFEEYMDWGSLTELIVGHERQLDEDTIAYILG